MCGEEAREIPWGGGKQGIPWAALWHGQGGGGWQAGRANVACLPINGADGVRSGGGGGGGGCSEPCWACMLGLVGGGGAVVVVI